MADTIICNRQQITNALSVTHRHIDNLIDAGIVVKLGRGEYDLIASCKNYVEFLRGSQSAEKLDLTQERTRLTKFQADLALIQLQQARREFLPVAIFTSHIQRLMVAVRSKMMSIPSALCSQFPEIERDAIIEMEEIIRRTLAEAAARIVSIIFRFFLKLKFCDLC